MTSHATKVPFKKGWNHNFKWDRQDELLLECICMRTDWIFKYELSNARHLTGFPKHYRFLGTTIFCHSSNDLVKHYFHTDALPRFWEYFLPLDYVSNDQYQVQHSIFLLHNSSFHVISFPINMAYVWTLLTFNLIPEDASDLICKTFWYTYIFTAISWWVLLFVSVERFSLVFAPSGICIASQKGYSFSWCFRSVLPRCSPNFA